MLKLLSGVAEASASGIRHGVHLTRQLWVRQAEQLGVRLPDRARQILRESPVVLSSLLGAGVERHCCQTGEACAREGVSPVLGPAGAETLCSLWSQGPFQ